MHLPDGSVYTVEKGLVYDKEGQAVDWAVGWDQGRPDTVCGLEIKHKTPDHVTNKQAEIWKCTAF